MTGYELGRDLQELRGRIERLEGSSPGQQGPSGGRRSGVMLPAAQAGIQREKPPTLWKLHKDAQLPAFVHSALGIRSGAKLDAAESQTWPCVPEPNILYVTWDAGGTDEFFRLSNQTFSLIRYTDPNTNITTAMASYSAQLTASGKGSNSYEPYDNFDYMDITLRDAGGGALFVFSGKFWVWCTANYPVTFMSEFPPGLYDLVKGANWQFNNVQISRC